MAEQIGTNGSLADATQSSDMNGIKNVLVGLDVGSTTVKAVVMDPETDEVLWKDYQRHQTKQPEKCFEFLQKIQEAFPLPWRIFVSSLPAAAGLRSKTTLGPSLFRR